MNKKIFRVLTALFAVLIMTTCFSVTAYAGGGEETPPTETPQPTAEPTPKPDPIRLTPDGNLTLVDDIDGEQAEDKQFITVVTKNGNYFYIIVDRAGDKENVYFLNLVDEADLMTLIEEMDDAPTKPVVAPQPEPDPQPTTPAEPEQEKEKGSAGGILILVLLIAAAGGGAFYYFKILKPKQAAQGGGNLTELDELNFDDEDDGFTGMEDEAEPEDDEEE